MKRVLAIASLLFGAPLAAAAHQLIVFASSDCDAVTVEAKFSSGKIAQQGEVRVLNGENNLLQTLELSTDGLAEILLDSVDHSTGLLIEVDTGGHENYWILTPEDIARSCGS